MQPLVASMAATVACAVDRGSRVTATEASRAVSAASAAALRAARARSCWAARDAARACLASLARRTACLTSSNAQLHVQPGLRRGVCERCGTGRASSEGLFGRLGSGPPWQARVCSEGQSVRLEFLLPSRTRRGGAMWENGHTINGRTTSMLSLHSICSRITRRRTLRNGEFNELSPPLVNNGADSFGCAACGFLSRRRKGRHPQLDGAATSLTPKARRNRPTPMTTSS